MEHFCFKSLILLILFYNSSALSSSNCTLAEIFKYDVPVANPNMRFYLFTSSNNEEEQEIKTNDFPSITSSLYNNQLKTKILVHGWKGNLTSCVNAYVKDAYLQKGYFNIIIVDWFDWARDINYLAVSTQELVDQLGRLLADFIDFLYVFGTPFENIDMIGYSMGAHLCGSAGRQLPNKINTIFGLDPAGSNFDGQTNKILKCSDANYVEAIITNMGGFFGWGYTTTIGCATYYPNYGNMQGYCLKNEPTNIVCEHVTSVRYFSESIISNIGFCAAKCSHLSVILRSCTNPMRSAYKMGGEPSVPKNGVFYVKTNDNPPFAMGCLT